MWGWQRQRERERERGKAKATLGLGGIEEERLRAARSMKPDCSGPAFSHVKTLLPAIIITFAINSSSIFTFFISLFFLYFKVVGRCFYSPHNHCYLLALIFFLLFYFRIMLSHAILADKQDHIPVHIKYF